MPRVSRKASRYQIVPLNFWQDNMAANQAAVAMNTLEVAGATNLVTEYVVPDQGWIVGISARTNTARTAGTLTADATINGTVTGLQAVLDGTNTQSHSAQQAAENDYFSQNQRIGVKLTTTAGWLPVNADIVVTVWCLVDALNMI